MTSRQQRRADERKSRKQSFRNGETTSQPTPVSLAEPVQPISLPSRLPKPDYTGLLATAELAIVLPGEDTVLYRSHLRDFLHQFNPADGVECVIVRRLADVQWRLKRIANLEAGILILGRRKYAELFTEADPAVQTALLDAHTLLTDGLVLRRLHTQENRLRRYYASDLSELAVLQSDRGNLQADDAPSETLTSIPLIGTDKNGFEFSTSYELDLSDESDPADCLNFMFGSDFLPDWKSKGATSKS